MIDRSARPRRWDMPYESLLRAVEELPQRDVLRAAVARAMAAVGRLQFELGPAVEPHPDQRPLSEWCAQAMRHMADAMAALPTSKAESQAELAYAAAVLLMALESQHRLAGYNYLPEEQ